MGLRPPAPDFWKDVFLLFSRVGDPGDRLEEPCRVHLRVPMGRVVTGRSADPGRASKGPGPKVDSTSFLEALQSKNEPRVWEAARLGLSPTQLLTRRPSWITSPSLNLCTCKMGTMTEPPPQGLYEHSMS